MKTVSGKIWAAAAMVPAAAATASHRRVAKANPVARKRRRDTSAARTIATADAGDRSRHERKAEADALRRLMAARETVRGPRPAKQRGWKKEDGKWKRALLTGLHRFHLPFPSAIYLELVVVERGFAFFTCLSSHCSVSAMTCMFDSRAA